jgi:hypothetical protein
MIDMASVYAARYKNNPDVLRAAVIGQSPDRKLDPYTALNALKLVNETNRMMMAGQAQQPTSAPSLVAQNMTPQAGLGAMVPGAMGQGAPAPQGMPPQGMPPQGQGAPAPQGMPPQGQAPVMQAASGGLAGMPTPEYEYAEGGIVAFQSGGLNMPAVTADPMANFAPAVNADPLANYYNNDDDDEDDEISTGAEITNTGQGNAGLQSVIFAKLNDSIKRARAITRREPTKEEKTAMFESIVSKLENVGGPDVYGDVNKSLTAREQAADKNYSQDKGLALIATAGNILKGSSLAEGISNAAPAFAGYMSEASKAKQAEARAIENMRFNINDAQRKERMGNRRAALSAMAEARKEEGEALTFKLNQEKAVQSALGAAMRATRPGAAGAGANAKPPKLPERLYDDNLANLLQTEKPNEGESDTAFKTRMRAEAGKLTARQVKDFGPEKAGSEEAKLTGKTDTDLDTRVAKEKIFDPAWQNATTSEEKDAAETALRNRIIARRQAQPTSQGKPSGGGVNKNSTNPPDISTIKGAPAGSTIGKSTAKGWEVLDSSGKLIGYAQK